MKVALGRGEHAQRTAVIGPLVLAVAAMVCGRLGAEQRVVFDVAWTAAALSATAGTGLARARTRPENRLRWTFWTFAAGSWLFGQVMWDLYEVVGFPASPNLADVGWWGFALGLALGVLRLPRAERSLLAVALMESLPLICATVSLCVALLWHSFIRSPAPLSVRITDLSYPCVYASAAILTLQAMLGGAIRRTLRGSSLPLFFCGSTTLAVAFILWGRGLLAHAGGGSLLDPVWVLGLGMIAVAGLLSAESPERAPGREEPNPLSVLLPAAMFALVFAALASEASAGASRRILEILGLGLVCSGAALIARSALLSRRIHRILARERRAMVTLREREAELARLNAQLELDARHDPLTGIANRRALADDLAHLARQRAESPEPVAVLLCDADAFKAYNDSFGHLAGDRALVLLASTARGVLTERDRAYRYGGEELLVVLRGRTEAGALRAAERIREAIQRVGLPHLDGPVGVLTVSIGVAWGPESVQDLLARADAALYRAKEAGRNRVVIADADGDRDTAALAAAVRRRERDHEGEEEAPPHLRSMLAVSRAAASEGGVMMILEALAEAIGRELSFGVVVVNLRDALGGFRVVIVQGDHRARAMLLDTVTTLADWDRLTACGERVAGAHWLPAGSYDPDGFADTWRPPMVASLDSDAWEPDDMLLLPLRGVDRSVLGFVSVDQPALGRRPNPEEIAVLMAVADHAGLALEQALRQDSLDEALISPRLAAAMQLAEALDLRDARTAVHSQTVGALARRIATEMGLPRTRVERLHAAGVLHDLGKLGIPDAILLKPACLDEGEWREMRRHPETGARILEHAGMRDIADWVRGHHERVDGSGYPRGLAGGAISLESRILSVADAYEAMVSERPYRPASSPRAAREELRRCAGSQFDPEVVEAFLRALDRDGERGAGAGVEPVRHDGQRCSRTSASLTG